MTKQKVIELLQNNEVGVLPTDTLYGLVGRALDKKVVTRIYKLRRRHPQKPCIVLISDWADLHFFNIKLSNKLRAKLRNYWPGPTSIILNCPGREFHYLHRGTRTLALRLPKHAWLRELLKETGPLLAPSANLEGRLPADSVSMAKHYFGSQVSFYYDVGRLSGSASALIQITSQGVKVLRQGSRMSSNDFRSRVLKAVSSIKPGEVKTYQQVSRLAGKRYAYRVVGSILRDNFDPDIPCHRVVGAEGRLGFYNRGQKQKARLLREEGILVRNGRIATPKTA